MRIQKQGGAFRLRLMNGPLGTLVNATESMDLGNNANEFMYKWDGIQTYGPGTYTFSTNSLKNANCAVLVSATSTVVVDGGFVSAINRMCVLVRTRVFKSHT